MPIDRHESGNPDIGYFRIPSERPFHYLVQDPGKLLLTWLTPTVGCPVCAATTGLLLACRFGHDPAVQVLCEAGHQWYEPAIDLTHFRAYARLRYGLDCDPDDLWIMNSGFGEEPPPPIDYTAEIAAAARDVAKYAARKSKAKIRRETRSLRRGARRTARRSLAALWKGLRPGGNQPADQPSAPKAGRGGAVPEEEYRTPSYAQYRKALGIPAQQRGPRCLVCADTGRITAPGVDISCTECGSGSGGSAGTGRGPRAGRTGTWTGAGVVNTGVIVGEVRNPDGSRSSVQLVGDQATVDGVQVGRNDPRVHQAVAQAGRMAAAAGLQAAEQIRAHADQVTTSADGTTTYTHTGITSHGRRLPKGTTVDEHGNTFQNNSD
jgi:hypothetical protein